MKKWMAEAPAKTKNNWEVNWLWGHVFKAPSSFILFLFYYFIAFLGFS
jgi:hypothetical protein